MERERKLELALELTGLGLLAIATLGAFTRPVRQKIRQRDGNRSVWSGETENLSVAHINHNKKSSKYDDESNGRTLTHPTEQYIDHFNRHGTENLGLNLSQNSWVLNLLWGLLKPQEKQKFPPPAEAGSRVIPIPRNKRV